MEEYHLLHIPLASDLLCDADALEVGAYDFIRDVWDGFRRRILSRWRAPIYDATIGPIRYLKRRMVLSHDDDAAIDAAARDFIRHPVSKRLKRMFLQEQHRTQKRRYEALMEDICGKKLSSEGFEKLFRKAELFQLIMGFKREDQEISFEEFCWRRDLLAKLMKQKGNSPAAAGETSNTVRSRRVQFSAASHCHCNNLGQQPGGSDYYSVPRNNNMMNLGGVPGGNGQAEVGRPNYGTDNGGGNDQMIGIQWYQGYGGVNNTNGVAGNGMGVGQFPSNANNIRGGRGDNINNVGASHGGHVMGAGRLPSIGNNIGGNSVDGTGNGNGQAEVGRPNYGTNNGGGNDQMIGIQPYQGYGGWNSTNNVTGNDMGIGQFPSNGNNIRGGSGDNINNIRGSHGGDRTGATRLPSIGNIGGNSVDGTGTNINNIAGYGMVMVEDPPNGNNVQGSGVDASGDIGGGHGGNGVGRALFPSTGNNTGGSGVFGSDLRLPSELFVGSINDWNDAELSDEELWLDLPELDEF
ncbi:hypothetical protein FEM48_Zijuj12G0074400 [Ziziphus jujuba var. spinosa]|uniref:Uncharacterized protein n=1 Tax=Ziziphus jujuba var. spinosa TaxID=714518 RepID=A0A978UBZ1_ZIZJJ|nr:uncharacterized transmembrane protein DDB_G0289901-like [Ziziphus jujuba var. spinosa]XP_048321002.1 uncharacterized transmembrane protein DDB_G0289901-like [Ziziphus jujuba var. spinosa]XP_048321003.1 uncharacterized transmembrane protein DDB_G0289901-like [Ziziphus jujuba var. spinosa]KAH7512284.1 hypothetical protein FEM48_Zijuj12G0074400 [Ziziphus jujuba var. spinosa]